MLKMISNEEKQGRECSLADRTFRLLAKRTLERKNIAKIRHLLPVVRASYV